MDESGFLGDVGEGAVAIVFEEMRDGFPALGETLKPPTVDEKKIEPTVVIVIVESHTAAGGFQKIFIFVLAAEDGFDVEARFLGDIDEVDADWRASDGRNNDRRLGAFNLKFGVCKRWENARKNILQGKNQSGTAKRAEKPAARGKQSLKYLPGESAC
jgi:hypothetical protein